MTEVTQTTVWWTTNDEQHDKFASEKKTNRQATRGAGTGGEQWGQLAPTTLEPWGSVPLQLFIGLGTVLAVVPIPQIRVCACGSQ